MQFLTAITLVKLLKEHYGKRLSHISLSPLMPGSGKCILDDVYVSPKICSVDINPMGKRKNVYQIGSYEELFYSSNKLNRKIFIQGEPGCGKSTFTAKMVLDWCIASNAATQETQRRRFMDIEKLKIFKFIFYISLRDSGDQNEVVEMMKDQIIRKLFSTAKHEQACKLIETIMTTEECLVILDGWDEWTDPHCKEPVPVLVESYQHCTVLTTTRVWKMKSRYMKDSDIGTLLELEGVLDPRELSEVLLSRLVGEEELYEKRAKFHFFITQHNFNQLIVSPVMLSVMVCSWIDEIHVKGSLCEIYSVLLECLFKKAAEEDTCISDPLQLSCLENKVCLQTNIEHLKCLSKTAFCLLFSDCRERSVVFTDKELSKFMSKQEKAFALKTGIITERECSTLTKESSTLCFFHKSVQEFLAAIHIAINSSVIQEDIARYLNVFPDAYLYIAQVFISLCGLNVIAASELSGLMDEHNDFFLSGFQKIICDGYKEAKSNEHDDSDINLKLSIFYFADHFNTDNLRKILMKNTSNVRFLHVIPVDTERSAPTYRRIYRSDDSDTSDTEKDKGTRDYFFDLDQIDVHEIVRASSHCLEHLEGVDEIPIDLLSKCKKLKQ
ncbi:hypothetical protein DPMN_041025 [Dreissena polymorpha]|uniref:NACHT domain-containing protein n=1 Tax=Dreissena polymorpha TaxID=45954 RepID=A0A9D4CYM5_DREPO|nr:hypothetical protein DPMN_041025 [Dreissena polymorpha]